LRFLNENDFPVIFYPTEKLEHCVTSMSYSMVAAELAAYEAEDRTSGHTRHFIEVVRNRAGSESAVVYRCPRPPGLVDDIVWSVDKPSGLPERFHLPRIADGLYLEPYEFIGLRRSDFAEDYARLVESGFPARALAVGRVLPPQDLLEGPMNNAGSTSQDAAKGVSAR
jgi:hypothetical protein